MIGWGACQGGTQPRKAPSRVREASLEVSFKLRPRKISRKRGRRHSMQRELHPHVKAQH